MAFTSRKGKTANEARMRGLEYQASRNANITRLDIDGRHYCATCGVDVGLVAVALDTVYLDGHAITVCRDCAKRVGELVGTAEPQSYFPKGSHPAGYLTPEERERNA